MGAVESFEFHLATTAASLPVQAHLQLHSARADDPPDDKQPVWHLPAESRPPLLSNPWAHFNAATFPEGAEEEFVSESDIDSDERNDMMFRDYSSGAEDGANASTMSDEDGVLIPTPETEEEARRNPQGFVLDRQGRISEEGFAGVINSIIRRENPIRRYGDGTRFYSLTPPTPTPSQLSGRSRSCPSPVASRCSKTRDRRRTMR